MMKAGTGAFFLLLSAFLAAPVSAEGLSGAQWRVTFETNALGPVEARLVFEETSGGIIGKSQSGAAALIATLPEAGTRDFGGALLTLSLHEEGAAYAGTARIAGRDYPARLTLEDGAIGGNIDGGLAGGDFSGARETAAGPIRDYAEVLASLKSVVAANIYKPKDLETAGYQTFLAHMEEIAATATDDFDFLLGFRYAWSDDPFSHFDLKRSAQPAEAMMAFFDDYRVGEPAARVTFDGDVAILDIDTMMGLDTIEYIEAAYKEIAAKGAKALVIELRDNGGGAFAVKPLVEHVIDAPLDAGVFASHKWNADHDRAPNAADAAAVPAWFGWSIIDFWRTVQAAPLLKVTFEPAEPNFDGPVYVVLNHASASATELAADALKASGAAILIGEPTAGQMLSQSPFDVAGGYMVSLPVADYFSLAHGRIEGRGVSPHIYVSSGMALEAAVLRARAAAQ